MPADKLTKAGVPKEKILQAVFLWHDGRFPKRANEFALRTALGQSGCNIQAIKLKRVRSRLVDLMRKEVNQILFYPQDVISCIIPFSISIDTLAHELSLGGEVPIKELSFRSISNPDEILAMMKFPEAVRLGFMQRIRLTVSRLF